MYLPASDATVSRAIARLAVHDLPGVTTEPVDATALDAPAGVLLDAAQRAQVTVFVHNAARTGQLTGLSNDERADLEQRVRASAGRTLATHAALIDAAARLRAQGIEAVVLKGCATAHLDHQRPHHRYSGDVDLLVAPGTLPRILAAGIGTPPALRSHRWEHRYAKSTTISDHHATEIDLHQRLAQGYPGLRIPHAELTATLEPFEVGGVEFRALDQPGRLLHAAVHAGASERVGLHSLRDVPQLVFAGDVDWKQAVRRAERWRIDLTAAAGVLRAWDAFPLPEHPLATWARQVRGDRRQRLAHSAHEHLWGGAEVSALLTLAPHRWPGYLGPLAFPSRAYLRSEGVTWTGRARRVARRLLTAPPEGR